MKVMIIIGCIMLALFLLSLIRVGATVEYAEGGVKVRVRLGVFWLTVFPIRVRKRREKPRKEKKTKKKASQKVPVPKPGGALAMIRSFLPLVAETAGRFKRKIRVDRIYLDFIAAASDPAAAALAFGGANAALGMLWVLLEHNFNIKDRRIRTNVDFNAQFPTIYLFASFSLTIGQSVVLVLRLLFQFLRRYSALKTEETLTPESETKAEQKEAV